VGNQQVDPVDESAVGLGEGVVGDRDAVRVDDAG
jgi:hypothetical protein